MTINPNYARRENENDLDYGMRLIGIKKELKPGDLDWCDIVELLGLDYNPDSLRKAQDSAYGGYAVYKEMKKRVVDNKDTNIKKEIDKELQDLRKLKFSIADERAALNKLLREQSRIESIKDLAVQCVGKMQPLNEKIRQNSNDRFYGNHSLVITLSDFHYGLEIDEFNNEYNSQIFHDRLSYLLSTCIDIILKDECIRNVIVLGIGDFISGIIHNIIRIESRENVVQQVIAVSEALIDFLYKLSAFCPVDYYDCVGNHSRLFEDKSNCLSKESFDLLIHYILKQRFQSEESISIYNYTVNEQIGEFDAFGKKYAFCHGDNFNIATLAKDLSAMTKNFYEAIFIGHIHHVFVEEQNGTLVISNGTFAGNDEYANRLRKTSIPSQNVFIISENGIEDIKTIKLDFSH